MPEIDQEAYDIADAVAGNCIVTRARMRARALTRLYDAALAPIGLRSTEYAVLIATGRFRSGRMHKIAAALSMDLSTLSRSMGKLGAKGLVTIHTEGHRTRLVTLTDKGHAILRAGYPHWQKAQTEAAAL